MMAKRKAYLLLCLGIWMLRHLPMLSIMFMELIINRKYTFQKLWEKLRFRIGVILLLLNFIKLKILVLSWRVNLVECNLVLITNFNLRMHGEEYKLNSLIKFGDYTIETKLETFLPQELTEMIAQLQSGHTSNHVLVF